MNTTDEELLAAIGLPTTANLSKVDRKLWLAYGRLASGNPALLRDDVNRTLLKEGRLEYGEAALAREAPASRNTISANRERLANILTGLAGLESARKAARKVTSDAVIEERRTSVQKDRIIEQQASLLAENQVIIHALKRRLAANERRSLKKDDPSPALGHRRRPAPATAPRGRGASRDPR